MKRYLQFIGLLLITTCVVSSSTHADDDVKRLIGGLAVGIVGQMLENTEQNQQEHQPAQNVKETSSQPSKHKLKYNADVAEIQSDLKKLGIYHGKVDGVKGRQTTEAIRSWEHFSGDSANGELSDKEMQKLKREVSDQEKYKNKKDNPIVVADDDRPKKISEMKGVKSQETLYEDMKNMVFYYKSGDSCADYKNQTGMFGKTLVSDKFNGQYTQYLDDELISLVSNAKSLEKKQIKHQAECHGINTDTLQGMYDRIEQEYKGSGLKLRLQGASAGIIQGYPDAEEKFVDECNAYAHKLKKEYKLLQQKSFNDDTCTYE